MALAEVQAVNIIPTDMENDSHDDDDGHGPLPTHEIAARRSSASENKCFARRHTSLSLNSFSSDSSVGSDPGKIVEVGDLRFLNDSEMPDGQSSILGKGSFAMVRLARRHAHMKKQRSASLVSGLSLECSEEHLLDPESPQLTPDSSQHGGVKLAAANAEGKEGTLVAVKIFEKSLLRKCRTVVRDSDNQMQVTTALENVEREIAVMKMIQHPNLVSLHEVIDTGSNRLYMVIEYLPLGEIMSNVPGTGIFKRRPARKGEVVKGVTKEGFFDEQHAALYFVDIMHGLAHLHKNHIVHRDLKPENILLDSRGFAKIADFGVAHLFKNEMNKTGRSSLSQSDLQPSIQAPSTARISRTESEYAMGMKSMSDMGQLTKTEGTWCFWSPEMCAENSLVFSGYACDIYAAGVCLYIFATGKLPIYTDIPLVLFDLIAEGDIKYDDLKVSDDLKDMLKKVMAKDPATRAGVGDCLSHPFCKDAREQRTKELGDDVEKHEEVVIQTKDLRQAFSATKRRSVAGVVSGGLLSIRKRFSFSQSFSMKSSSMSIDETGSAAKKGTAATSRKRVTFPFPSQKTMSMDDEDEDGSSSKNSRRKGLGSLFWRSTGQMNCK